jgi:hypothetical protein
VGSDGARGVQSPDARRALPDLRHWARRQDWEAVPPGSFRFTIRCPRYAAVAAVGDAGYG